MIKGGEKMNATARIANWNLCSEQSNTSFKDKAVKFMKTQKIDFKEMT